VLIDFDRVIPVLATTLILSIPAGAIWAWGTGTNPVLGVATAMGLGTILAVTLFQTGLLPDDDYVIGVCDLRRIGPGTIDELLSLGESSLNVLLFMPLGTCLAWHAGGARRVGIVAAAALPFVIELVQLALPQLGRYCDSGDIADNLTGLGLGILGGLAVAGLGGLLRGSLARQMTPPPD
jgi:hypothetical protein